MKSLKRIAESKRNNNSWLKERFQSSNKNLNLCHDINSCGEYHVYNGIYGNDSVNNSKELYIVTWQQIC